MAHPKARLNVLGRELLVTRVTVLGWPVTTAADAQGISRATGYKWVRRFRAEGTPGLADRSSRPHRSPRATPAAEVARILAARTKWRWGPDRLGPLLELPRSTVAAVLHREQVPRLADLDRPTGLPVRRYQACHPGELVHQDHKKLGRIPDGGGHRALGRTSRTPRARGNLGYDHFEVVVDDRSRRTVVVPVADDSGASAAAALELALAAFEAEGIAVERVMTDNAWAYRGREYRAVLGDRRQTRTRPYRPQTNGKAERFIGTLIREWAYARTYTTNNARLAALEGFVHFYNHRRPHTALGGLSPAAVVNNVHGDHS